MVGMTLKDIKQIVSYDGRSGHFRWKQNRGRNARIGEIAGRLTFTGYRHICIAQKEYLAHRLAWWFIHGEHPTSWVDHINGKRDDNRIINLRVVTLTQSSHNARPKKNSTTGLKGVTPVGNRFMARIRFGGKRIHLGSFASAEEAAEAYRNTALTLQGEYAPIE